ncbi:MAG: hypothetical protein PVG06_18170 [Desulfobacterales bacterium]|jgi:hypothetical protein
MGEIKLDEAPTMTVIANGIPITPRFSAMAIGNIKTADATLVIIVSMKMQPKKTTVIAMTEYRDGAPAGFCF